MLRYLIRRLLAMVPLLLVITGSVFLLGQYGSGDLAMTLTMRMTDNNFDETIYREMVSKLHQDEPVLKRFWRFVSGAVQGDFGVSYVLQGTPEIGRMIVKSLPLSVQLGLDAIILVILIGIPLGVVAAAWRNTSIDYSIVGVVTILSSIPPFVLAPIALVVLVAQLKIIPTVSTGWNGMFSREAFLPAACLSVGPMLGVVRYTRASVIDTLSQEYIRAARARGLSEILVIVRHVIKNSMTPVLTVLGVTIGRLLSGSIFIETVFGIQGIGSVAVLAFQSGDIQTVAATTLVTASLVMASNLVVDMLYGVLDPRVRLT
jgi:ABC-type dipeptide/oligopeptide/nickel transport system permease component